MHKYFPNVCRVNDYIEHYLVLEVYRNILIVNSYIFFFILYGRALVLQAQGYVG